MNELEKLFEASLTSDLKKIVFGALRKKSLPYKKVTLRPISIKGKLQFQIEYTHEKKVIQENVDGAAALDKCVNFITNDFKQVNIFTAGEDIQVLAKNPENPRIQHSPTTQSPLSKTQPASPAADKSATPAKISPLSVLSHNRTKNYIIPDGKPCDFLIELGVMGEDGRVFQRSYAKFRQINRYLEIVADSMKDLAEFEAQSSERKGPFRVIDFGCGKAYLTFALYYYLKIQKGLDVEIIGLDLKEDVISFCERTARKLNYEGLSFLHGDIADYESDGADMVVTLHACDVATDYALANAVRWHSRIILSVPCCQHELFKQIKNSVTGSMFKHGILKERFTEILTDGLRGLKLESKGYDVAMIEFTSLEHTARNIMIKAICKDPECRGKRCQKALEEYEALCSEYNVKPTTSII